MHGACGTYIEVVSQYPEMYRTILRFTILLLPINMHRDDIIIS
jgi:hypothetical protein